MIANTKTIYMDLHINFFIQITCLYVANSYNTTQIGAKIYLFIYLFIFTSLACLGLCEMCNSVGPLLVCLPTVLTR